MSRLKLESFNDVKLSSSEAADIKGGEVILVNSSTTYGTGSAYGAATCRDVDLYDTNSGASVTIAQADPNEEINYHNGNCVTHDGYYA